MQANFRFQPEADQPRFFEPEAHQPFFLAEAEPIFDFRLEPPLLQSKIQNPKSKIIGRKKAFAKEDHLLRKVGS